MTQIIAVPPFKEDPAPAILPEGEKIKNELLALASSVAIVLAEEKERDLAINLAGRIKGHIDEVEKYRKSLGEPYYNTWKKINELASKHVNELNSEMIRLNRAVGAFNQKVRDDLRKKQEALEAEQRRLAQEIEAKAAESRRLAEEIRKKEEALAAKGKELSDAQKAKVLEAQLDAEEAQEEARRKSDELCQQKIQEAEEARKKAATGGISRVEIEIEVFDLKALYAAHPSLVILKPDVVGIKYFINHYLKEGEQIPGVRFTRTPIYTAKAR